MIPGELSSINTRPLLTEEKGKLDYSLNILGLEVSSWNAQQAGLHTEDVRTKNKTEIITEDNTVTLD